MQAKTDSSEMNNFYRIVFFFLQNYKFKMQTKTAENEPLRAEYDIANDSIESIEPYSVVTLMPCL